MLTLSYTDVLNNQVLYYSIDDLCFCLEFLTGGNDSQTLQNLLFNLNEWVIVWLQSTISICRPLTHIDGLVEEVPRDGAVGARLQDHPHRLLARGGGEAPHHLAVSYINI